MIKSTISKWKRNSRTKAYTKEFGPRYQANCITEDSKVKVEFTVTIRASSEAVAREKVLINRDKTTRIISITKLD